MLMKYILLGLCFCLLFLECKKEKAFKIDASKITAVDENGDPNGETDPTDWKFVDEWNAKELALFNFGDTVSTLGMQQATAFSALVAPNPTASDFSLTFRTNQPTLLKWIITDEYLNVLFARVYRMEKNINIDPNVGFGLNAQNSRFKGPGYYRVYYAFYSQGGILYKKGHGDFKKL